MLKDAAENYPAWLAAKLLVIVGAVLLIFALLLIFFPRIASIPLVIILLMLALPTLLKALKNYRNN